MECPIAASKFSFIPGKTYSYTYTGKSKVQLKGVEGGLAETRWEKKVLLTWLSPCDVAVSFKDTKVDGEEGKCCTKPKITVCRARKHETSCFFSLKDIMVDVEVGKLVPKLQHITTPLCGGARQHALINEASFFLFRCTRRKHPGEVPASGGDDRRSSAAGVQSPGRRHLGDQHEKRRGLGLAGQPAVTLHHQLRTQLDRGNLKYKTSFLTFLLHLV